MNNKNIRALSLAALNTQFKGKLGKVLVTDEDVIDAIPVFESASVDKDKDGNSLASGKNIEVSIKKMLLKILFPESKVLSRSKVILDGTGNPIACEGYSYIWLEGKGSEDNFASADAYGQRRMSIDEASPFVSMTRDERINHCLQLVKGYAFAEAAREVGIGAGYPLYGRDVQNIEKAMGIGTIEIAESKALHTVNDKHNLCLSNNPVSLPMGTVSTASAEDMVALVNAETEKEKKTRKKKSAVVETTTSSIPISSPATPAPSPVTHAATNEIPIPVTEDLGFDAAPTDEAVPVSSGMTLEEAKAVRLTSKPDSSFAGKTMEQIKAESLTAFNWLCQHSSELSQEERDAIQALSAE